LDSEVLDSWDFDVFFFTPDQLIAYVALMFMHLGLTTQDVSRHEVCAQVRNQYRAVPYHNFFHCVDVTHATFRFIRLAGSRARMTPSEKLALMIAALCHDMDHPGLNNAFLINTRHEYARLYNDNSVLENRHVSLLYTLLADQPHADVLADMDDARWRDMRKTIINAIIHTDMVHHFPMVAKLNAAAINANVRGTEAAGADAGPGIFKTPEDRHFMLALMLHCADISNAVKPIAIAQKWANRVLEEFFLQGDQERAQGLPVSPLMDRHTTSLAISQINFIEFVVAPLFHQVGRVFPELRATVQYLWENRRLWNELYLADIEADTFKTQAEKDADRVRPSETHS
ncbi:HD-domain/PDEase-like protein, partial [Coccomyxa subellipsoidea C-169]